MVVLANAGIDIFIQQILIGLTQGAIYALVALGYTLVYGIVELINFAHGDVFMWSTLITLVVLNALHITGPVGGIALVGLLLLLMVVGAVAAALINYSIERVAYRRLRKAPRLAPLIAAIGASFVLENVALLWKGPSPISYPAFFPSSFILIGSIKISLLYVIIIVMAIVMMIGLTVLVQSTKLGKSMRATAQDPEAAALMGINIDNTIGAAFLIGGALAGSVGVFYSLFNANSTWYLAGFKLGLIAFTAAVLGGIGNMRGAMLGGFLIGLVTSLSTQYLPNGIDLSDAVVFGLLVLIFIFRPSGLLGQQVPDKV